MSYKPIENYGIIGDLHTIALVGMDGSIDFMSFPQFDSPTIFAALLDENRGGGFQLAPVLADANRKQLYLPDSNILLTRFLSDEGVAEISDFMPVQPDERTHELVRRAKTVRGEVHFLMVCQPRFDYARSKHHVEKRDGEILFVSEGNDQSALRLRTSIPVTIRDGAAVAEFTLQAGQSAAFVLEEAPPGPGIGLSSSGSCPRFL